ncbi:MAG: DMT family transporter [Candidatus Hodarchaeales archaeon]|jgi:drug/metabolite transporter (DMT)-like permease
MQSNSTLSKREYLLWSFLLTTVAFFWGTTFVLVKDALNDITPINFIQIRFIGTIILALLTLRWFYRNSTLKELLFNKYGWFLGFLLYLTYFFQTVGLVYTTPSKAAFVTGMSVPLVPLFLLIFWRKKISILNVMWSLIAFFGLAILTIEVSEIISVNTGDIIVLGTAIAIAFHLIYMEKYSQQENDGNLILSQFLATAFYSIIFYLITDFPFNGFDIGIILRFNVIVALFVTIVFATIFAFSIQIFAQKRGMSAIIVALIFASEPVFALIISLLAGAEELTFNGLIGSTIIMIAILGSIFSQFRNSKVEKHQLQKGL